MGDRAHGRFTPNALKQSLGVCRPLLTDCGLLRLLNPCFYPALGGRFKDMGAALRAFFVATALWKAVFEKAPSTAPPPLGDFLRPVAPSSGRKHWPPDWKRRRAAPRCAAAATWAQRVFGGEKRARGAVGPPALYKRAGMRPGPVEESRPGPVPAPAPREAGDVGLLRRRSLRLSPSAPL